MVGPCRSNKACYWACPVILSCITVLQGLVLWVMKSCVNQFSYSNYFLFVTYCLSGLVLCTWVWSFTVIMFTWYPFILWTCIRICTFKEKVNNFMYFWTAVVFCVKWTICPNDGNQERSNILLNHQFLEPMKGFWSVRYTCIIIHVIKNIKI